ncbi:hypothetical protein VTG60DRAFT_2565 [Thermothelomyces hinnuleus]
MGGPTYLLSKGADIEARNEDGMTPLLAAIDRQYPEGFWREETVRVLLRHGADVHARVEKNGSQDERALGARNTMEPRIVELLLDAGLDPNALPLVQVELKTGDQPAEKDESDPEKDAAEGDEGEEDDVEYGHEEEEEEEEAKVEAVRYALYEAARPPMLRFPRRDPGARQQAVIDLLVSHGADAHAAYPNGQFVLQAIVEDHGGCMPCWTSEPIHSPSTMRAVHLCTGFCTLPGQFDEAHRDAFANLTPHGPAAVNTADKQGRKPLHLALAAYASRTQHSLFAVEHLLSAGAGPADADPVTGNSALHFIAQRLVGESAAAAAATALFRSLASRLDINARNAAGETPEGGRIQGQGLGQQQQQQEQQQQQQQQQHDARRGAGRRVCGPGPGLGADLAAVDGRGRALPHVTAGREVDTTSYSNWAQRKDIEDAFKKLTELGVDPRREDDELRTAIDISVARGLKEIVSLFSEEGKRAEERWQKKNKEEEEGGDEEDDEDENEEEESEDDDELDNKVDKQAMASWLISSLLTAASLTWLVLPTDASPAHLQSSIAFKDNSTTAPVVKVLNGSYAGIHSAEFNQDFFLGMPYAQKAPRFTVSQPLNSSWEGVRNATAYPKHCIGYGGDNVGYEVSEDCLYLNVVRPAGISETAGLPVAVWIHGGGLFMGGSADKRYNLSFIVQNSVELGTPMIGVSLNYRLSAFGFPCGREAAEEGVTNLGFKDQRLALRWVNENIAAFGGAPDKVTIWGESSGAESVTAQTLAYGGRDDGLFRGVIAQSGFGGFIPRYPGNLNNTVSVQETYDALVAGTPCRDTAGTPASSLDCLRALPLDDLHRALNGTTAVDGIPLANRFPPVLDGDFVADYPSKQLREGRFPRVRALIGTNSDEGSSFRAGFGPDGGGGGIDTDEEMRKAIASIVGADLERTAGKTVEQVVNELAYLYPDIQAVGIPSLDKWPAIHPGDPVADNMGAQYRRAAALFGDFHMQFARRQASIAFAAQGLPSWSYRFDVVLPHLPGFIGATHFQEVAFAFGNTRGDGYAQNPFANNTERLTALSRTMSTAWINFITGQDPNGPEGILTGLPGGETWPVYDPAVGGGVGQNMVWSEEGSYVEMDSFRAQGINYFIENSLAVFGL